MSDVLEKQLDTESTADRLSKLEKALDQVVASPSTETAPIAKALSLISTEESMTEIFKGSPEGIASVQKVFEKACFLSNQSIKSRLKKALGEKNFA